MDLKIFLMATIVVCLKMPEGHGSLYHTRRHQCIPPLVRLYEPKVYNVAGASICAIKCSKDSCLFFEFVDPDECKIYGVGMESTNVYVNTDVAAPPAGGPLQEMAKGKLPYTSGGWNPASYAVDDDLSSRWEGGGLYPWWMVDLGAYYIIHFVDILPRKGGFAYRFQEVEMLSIVDQLNIDETQNMCVMVFKTLDPMPTIFQVRAGTDLPVDRDLSQWEFIGLYPGIYNGGEGRVHFNTSQGVCGRFLSVQQTSQLNDAFALCDVEVYIRKLNPY